MYTNPRVMRIVRCECDWNPSTCRHVLCVVYTGVPDAKSRVIHCAGHLVLVLRFYSRQEGALSRTCENYCSGTFVAYASIVVFFVVYMLPHSDVCASRTKFVYVCSHAKPHVRTQPWASGAGRSVRVAASQRGLSCKKKGASRPPSARLG